MTAGARASGGSPPTARVVRVLEHLAAKPDGPRTVTEIARELGIARATCALVVDELADAGWLVQLDRGYVLGPRIVPVARLAMTSPAPGGPAHDELVALAKDLDLVCTTSAVLNDYIVVLDRAGPVTTDGFEVRVGLRYPFAPPSGIVNVAWEPDPVVDAWLRRSPRPLPDEDRERLWQVVRDVRESGVLIERLDDQAFQVQALLANLATEDLSDALRRAVGDALVPLASRDYRRPDLRPGRRYPISLIVAPSFDSTGRQRLVVGVFVARADVDYDDAMRMAERVRATADRITEWVGGIDPWR